MCNNPSNPLFSWRTNKSQQNKKCHTVLWFYASSVALFAGTCLPAGSRAAVPSFLLKQASLLWSWQTLLFRPAPLHSNSELCSAQRCRESYWVPKTPPPRLWPPMRTPGCCLVWLNCLPKSVLWSPGPVGEAEAKAANTDHEPLDASADDYFCMSSSVIAARSQRCVNSKMDRKEMIVV